MEGNQVSSLLNLLRIACGEVPTNLSYQQEVMKTLETQCSQDGWVVPVIQIITSPANSGISVNCKLLATTILKYILKHRWVQRGSNSAISEEEKGIVRQALISHTCTEDRRLGLQVAILIAKIARFDFTTGFWDALFQRVLGLMQSIDMQEKIYGASVLLEITTELTSIRLRDVNNAFLKIVSTLLPIISAPLNSHFNEYIQTLNAIVSGNQSSETLQTNYVISEYLTISFKALHIMLKSALNSVSMLPAPTVNELFSMFQRSVDHICPTLRAFKSLAITSGLRYDEVYDIDVIGGEFHPQLKDSKPFIVILHCSIRLFQTAVCIPSELISTHPIDLVPFLESFLHSYTTQLVEECQQPINVPIDKSLIICSCRIISHVLTCAQYIPNQDKSVDGISRGNVAVMSRVLMGKSSEGDSRSIEIACNIRTSFLVESNVKKILELCLHKLLVYSQENLQEWVDEPERFLTTLESASIQDNVIAAAEKLYLDLLSNSTNIVAPVILSYLYDTQRQIACVSSDSEGGSVLQQQQHDADVLFWDAVFLCVGVASDVFSSHVNPSDLLTKLLVPLVQHVLRAPKCGAVSNGAQVLRARVMWLLSCWLGLFEASVLPDVVNLINSVLSTQSQCDIVASIRTIKLLSAALNCEGMRKEMLAPHVLTLTRSLCMFMKGLEETDLQAEVVTVLNELWTQAGNAVAPMIPQLADFLGEMWSNDDKNKIINISILQALTSLVKVSKESSVSIHPTCLPLVHHAIVTSSQNRHNASSGNIPNSSNDNNIDCGEMSPENLLMAQGIELWLNLVQNVPREAYTPTLDQLAKDCIETIFKDGSWEDAGDDVLKNIMLAIESQAIIGGAQTLVMLQPSLTLMYEKLFDNVEPRETPVIVRPLESFFLRCPQESTAFVVHSGLLQKMIYICSAHFDEFAEALREDYHAEIVIVVYLSIIARVTLCSSEALMSATMACGPLWVTKGISISSPMTVVYLLHRLMIKYFDSLDYLSAGSWRRKLWMLALWSLYPTNEITVLNWLPDLIFQTESTVIQLENDAASQSHYVAALLSAPSNEDAVSFGDDIQAHANAAVKNMTIAVQSDIVQTKNLRHVVAEKMNALQSLIGANELNTILQPCTNSIQFLMRS